MPINMFRCSVISIWLMFIYLLFLSFFHIWLCSVFYAQHIVFIFLFRSHSHEHDSHLFFINVSLNLFGYILSVDSRHWAFCFSSFYVTANATCFIHDSLLLYIIDALSKPFLTYSTYAAPSTMLPCFCDD